MKGLDSYELKARSSLPRSSNTTLRCGCRWEFPVYDVGERCELNLVERPLVAAEARELYLSVIDF